jgi:hypothetical protein
MKRKNIFSKTIMTMLATGLALAGCKQDPFDGIISNERAVESINLGDGFVQVGPAIIDRENSKASVRVLVQDGKNFTSVPLDIISSYKSTISPQSGSAINFVASNNLTTYTVTSESGETRQWTIELVPFTEELLGTYDIQRTQVFGGTGPEYNGAAVLQFTDKPWDWSDTDGPDKELDNKLTFEWGGVTTDGKTYGPFTNSAGTDGLYANYVFTADPQTDVNHFYRTMPKGTGTWQHDYANNVINFVFDDGTTYTCVFRGAGTLTLGKDQNGNDYTKTITDNSFDFTLNGVDDWNKIYSDYDKFVERPRRFWIDVKKE